MLAAHVDRWELEGRAILFDRTTGRSVALDPTSLEDLSGPLVDRLARLGMIASRPLDRAALIACRSRLPLLRPDRSELWYPHPNVHSAGGHGFVALRLAPDQVAIWRAINDARTVAQVAKHVGRSVDEVLQTLTGWLAPDTQLVQLRDARPPPADRSLWRMVVSPRTRSARTADQHGADGATDLVAYHLAIDDGPVHFDDRETTVAHAFGLAHPALGGRTFGGALFDALAGEGFWPANGPTIEVGCGDGEMAEVIAARLGTRYVRVDLSPGLLATQRARVPSSPGVLGDARRLPLRESSIARVLSNEVIADLPAVPVGPADDGPSVREVRDRLARYGLAAPAFRRWYNLGAWQFVEEVARVLVPGGRAYVSEFGSIDEDPAEAVQLDHPEVGIHFGELAAVARGCGLGARVVRLDRWLDFDDAARQLWRQHHMALRAMTRAVDHHLPARAWTPESLTAALPFPVEGLAFVPVTEPGAGPVPSRFYALLLDRPRQ